MLLLCTTCLHFAICLQLIQLTGDSLAPRAKSNKLVGILLHMFAGHSHSSFLRLFEKPSTTYNRSIQDPNQHVPLLWCHSHYRTVPFKEFRTIQEVTYVLVTSLSRLFEAFHIYYGPPKYTINHFVYTKSSCKVDALLNSRKKKYYQFRLIESVEKIGVHSR
jgi:hypothetical protein